MKSILSGPMILPGAGPLPLSRATGAGGLVFVSGQLGLDTSGRLVDGGIGAQTNQAISNLAAILSQAGLTLADVVKVTGWLSDAEDFAAFNSAYATHFQDGPPARSIVVSSLLVPGARIELEAIAAVP